MTTESGDGSLLSAEIERLERELATAHGALNAAPSPLGEVGESAGRYARWFMVYFGPATTRRIWEDSSDV
ncbi:MAG TPA: hypothetical protein VG265_05860 [Gaiellaceae bacterium]|jgi:hypothetical protein|nr:hypothetical protein [Gaiellaceae bacterium]